MNPKHDHFFRGAAVLLSGILFLTQVLALHAEEKSFWEERRIVANRSQGALANAFPEMSPVSLGLTTLSVTRGKELDLPSHVPLWLEQLVAPYGTLRFAYRAPRADAPFVLHIQDLHGSLPAQENMAKMIQTLGEERGIDLVGLEGAEGSFTLDDFHRYPSQKIKENVAHFFLKKGLIGAGESAGLTSNKPLTLWGVEDMALYRENVHAVKASLSNRDRANAVLARMNSALAERKAIYYSDRLRAFDRSFSDYQQEKIGLSGFIQTLVLLRPLVKGAPLSPTLSALLAALKAEETMDFKGVERERLALAHILAERLDRESLKTLVRESVDYRVGRRTCVQYRRTLTRICSRTNIHLVNFPHLSSYMDYVGQAEGIHRDHLLTDLDDLERSTQSLLAQTSEQKILAGLTVDIRLLTKLLNNQMSPADWKDYTQRRASLLQMDHRFRKLPTLGGGGFAFDETLAALVKPSETFCRCALERNDALTSRLLEKMAKTKTATAILVAGGFHTEGLTALLRSHGVSYVVLTPKVDPPIAENQYLDVFARDPLPLEKLFKGELISLIAERGLADSSSSKQLIERILLAGLMSFLSSKAQSLEKFGLSPRRIYDELQHQLTSLVDLIGHRLQATDPRIDGYDRGQVSLSFKGDNGERFVLKGAPDGGVTGGAASSPGLDLHAVVGFILGVWSQINRYGKILLRKFRITDFIETLLYPMVATPDGLMFSVSMGENPPPGSDPLGSLPTEISEYAIARRSNKIGAGPKIRKFVWATLRSNGKKQVLINSIKSVINGLVGTSHEEDIGPLVDVLGWLSTDTHSIFFLNSINGRIEDRASKRQVDIAVEGAVRYINETVALRKGLQETSPEGLFYGPFNEVKSGAFPEKTLHALNIKHEHFDPAATMITTVETKGEKVFLTKSYFTRTNGPHFRQPLRRKHLKLSAIPGKGLSPSIEGARVSLQTPYKSMELRDVVLMDYIATRWFQRLGMNVPDVQLKIDGEGVPFIKKTVGVSDHLTLNSLSEEELKDLLEMAAFPVMSEILHHIFFSNAQQAGYSFDVGRWGFQPDRILAKEDAQLWFDHRFNLTWNGPVGPAGQKLRMMATLVNNIPIEEVREIVTEAYRLVYGDMAKRKELEVQVFLSNFETLRQTLGEYHMVSPVSPKSVPQAGAFALWGLVGVRDVTLNGILESLLLFLAIPLWMSGHLPLDSPKGVVELVLAGLTLSLLPSAYSMAGLFLIHFLGGVRQSDGSYVALWNSDFNTTLATAVHATKTASVSMAMVPFLAAGFLTGSFMPWALVGGAIGTVLHGGRNFLIHGAGRSLTRREDVELKKLSEVLGGGQPGPALRPLAQRIRQVILRGRPFTKGDQFRLAVDLLSEKRDDLAPGDRVIGLPVDSTKWDDAVNIALAVEIRAAARRAGSPARLILLTPERTPSGMGSLADVLSPQEYVWMTQSNHVLWHSTEGREFSGGKYGGKEIIHTLKLHSPTFAGDPSAFNMDGLDTVVSPIFALAREVIRTIQRITALRTQA